jgi:xanthine/uracil permease
MNISSLTNDIKDYVHTQINVIKLNAVKKIEPVIASAILAIALGFLGFFALLFLSISAALAISSYAEMPFLGFLVVGCFYLLIATLIFIFRQKLLNKPIIKGLLKTLKYSRHQ